MSEIKTMMLIGVGAVLLSAILDVILLELHAGGEALFLSIAFVGVIASVVMTRVIKHYQALDQRRKREATLKLR